MASIFTKIIKGEIPSYKVYENEHCLAFLDIQPIHSGHTLVVPKIEVDHFSDLPEPYYSAVFQAAKILSKAIGKATGCPRVGAAIVGFEVPHFHYHLVPLWGPADLNFKNAKKQTAEEMQDMQVRIKKALNASV